MIKVFYGENRLQAGENAKKFLGKDYEVVEGGELDVNDLPNIFWGNSLFCEERAILVRDLLLNKVLQNELEKYLDTKHKIALLEFKVDKRSNVYKKIKDKVEFLEYKMPRDLNAGLVFDIYNVAKRDGQKAISMLEKIQNDQDPIMFEGLLVSQALKDYSARAGAKEKRVLAELSKLDTDLKSSNIDSWLLIKAFLLRLTTWLV